MTREMLARKAALLLLCDARPGDCACLGDLFVQEWERLLYWLDTSGLALYFLDRVVELHQTAIFPAAVFAALRQRLRDNLARMESMLSESAELHRAFQAADLCYASLKGFSLWPHSVPKPELRSQLDLDFLIAEESAPKARRILEERGYGLQAISGRSWEFKTFEPPGLSLDQLYKSGACRSVELHLENRDNCRSSLARVQNLSFRGICMPVLSPVDLFLGQGLHLFKHVSSEFSRIAHWLEFRRHVVARFHDRAFWDSLRSMCCANPRASTALGVVTLLVSRVTGDFAPAAFTSWTADSLPTGARRWAESYAERVAFASFPGNKLYLLLQKELAASGVPAKRPLWRSLVPTRLPPSVIPVAPEETHTLRLRRYRTQIWFVFFRLRFHLVHGFMYLCESVRWRFAMTGSAR